MKKTSAILFVIGFLFYGMIANSQNLKNVYLSGTINVDPDLIDIIIIIDNSGLVPEATMYIPEQFIYGMEAQETELIGDSLLIKFKKLSSEYVGLWNADSLFFEGFWKQGGYEAPTNLKTVDKSDIDFIERPQTPEPPYNYVVRDYAIENKKGNCTLVGTLTIPDTVGVFPLVVLISGSGAQNRDEEVVGHKPFLVLADYLTKNGIAVFRYDDRGFGQSPIDVMNSTTYDFMTDALAVIKYFETNPNINKSEIGVAGHSEGGIIAMMLAAKYPKNIDFIISMAGPGVDSKTLLLKQIEGISSAEQIDKKSLDILHAMQLEIMDIPEKSKDMVELRKKISDVYAEYSLLFTEDQREEFGLNQQGINMAVMQFSYPWMKYFLTINPVVYLKKIKCPVLAINGSKDIQVDADDNLQAIEKALSEGKCPYYKIEKIEGLNHLFQNADKGTVQEYFTIRQTFSEEPMILIKDFILGLQKKGN